MSTDIGRTHTLRLTFLAFACSGCWRQTSIRLFSAQYAAFLGFKASKFKLVLEFRHDNGAFDFDKGWIGRGGHTLNWKLSKRSSLLFQLLSSVVRLRMLPMAAKLDSFSVGSVVFFTLSSLIQLYDYLPTSALASC